MLSSRMRAVVKVETPFFFGILGRGILDGYRGGVLEIGDPKKWVFHFLSPWSVYLQRLPFTGTALPFWAAIREWYPTQVWNNGCFSLCTVVCLFNV